MEYQFNITADEYDVLQRLAKRRQQAKGIALTEEQIVKAALESLRQDGCVRQVLKKQLSSVNTVN